MIDRGLNFTIAGRFTVDAPIASRVGRRSPLGAFALILLGIWASTSSGALALAQDLLDAEPHDRITLTPAQGGDVLVVYPLELSRRLAPATIPTTGQIRVRLLDQPESQYHLAWRDVARVETYEQMLVVEAGALVAQRRFDEAFANLQYVHASSPDTPGLNTAWDRFLLENAAARFAAGASDAALGMLLELAARSPNHASLPGALNSVADRIISQYVEGEKYSAARAILDLVVEKTPDRELPLESSWPTRLQSLAEERLSSASEHFRAGRYVDARAAVREAAAIWPLDARAGDLARQIQQAAQMVVVGVSGAGSIDSGQRLFDWNGRRVERLLGRRLVELTGYDSQGARYRRPFGELTHDDSGRRWSLQLRPGGANDSNGAKKPLTGYDVAPMFLSRGRLPPMASVEVRDVFQVQLELQWPTIAAEAFLSVPLRAEGTAAYTIATDAAVSDTASFAEGATGHMTFLASGTYGFDADNQRPRAIVEVAFRDDSQAVDALLAGEIDVVDRVMPWNVGRLSSDERVVVAEYSLPTVHAIVPISDHPWVQTREFRRALAYGIPRQRIVQQVLAAADDGRDATVVSGPFPIGRPLNDPLAYAYDTLVEPRPYDPRLAAGLFAVARRAAAPASTGQDAEPESSESPEAAESLVLAHFDDPLARELCQIIKQQIAALGVELTLVELHDAMRPTELDKVDLLYVEVAVWEPVRNVHELLGAGGLARRGGPRLPSELVGLKRAGSWTEIRERLQGLHRIVHEDLPLIPLWQTTNYFAYRRGLAGIGQQPLVLYQDVEQWDAQELQWLR